MNDRSRRTFGKALKVTVVELHKNGKSSREISHDLDIPSEMVRRWSREYSAVGDSNFTGNGKPVVTPEQQEINDLKKVLKQAHIGRDILKKGRKHLLQETKNIQVHERPRRRIYCLEDVPGF